MTSVKKFARSPAMPEPIGDGPEATPVRASWSPQDVQHELPYDVANRLATGCSPRVLAYRPALRSHRGPLAVAIGCRATGTGLETAIARQTSTFTIEACDAGGERLEAGGEPFRVDVRGSSSVRARVGDNEDGTYTVSYVPACSGTYDIAISLHGIPLPQSPWKVEVLMPRPVAAKCQIRGEALRKAVAREPATFEVSFMDGLGQPTHAEEIDIYVELLECEDDGQDALERMVAQYEAVEARFAPPEVVPVPEEEDDEGNTAAPGAAETGSSSVKQVGGQEESAPMPEGGALSPGTRLPTEQYKHDEAAEEEARRELSERPILRQVAGPNPLIVRADVSLDSEQLGVLTVGSVVRVDVARRTQDGLRARCILPTLDDERAEIESVTSARGSASMSGVKGSPRFMVGGESAQRTLDGVPIPTGTPLHADPWHVYNEEAVRWQQGGDGRPSSRGASSRGEGFGQKPPGLVWPARTSSAQMNAGGSSASAVFRPKGWQVADGLESLGPRPTHGWVTAQKGADTKLFLTPPHPELDAGQRQRHMSLWSRRASLEKIQKASSAAQKQLGEKAGKHALVEAGGNKWKDELQADKSGVAFAFGGVEPGVIHAKGHVVKTHAVKYSIGLAGRYRLHVGLRQQGVALPGSPFLLSVLPGEAYAPSTRMREEDLPLQGVIGTDAGCTTVLRTADKMGNLCVAGGANVTIYAGHNQNGDGSGQGAAVQTSVDDNEDGSYTLRWVSEQAGTFPVRVMIGGVHVHGSPTILTILAGHPDVAKCIVKGEGLRRAKAGLPAAVSILARDRYDNIARQVSSHKRLRFGLALLPPLAGGAKDSKAAKAAAEDVESMDFEGSWEDDAHYSIQFWAKAAGEFELHLWVDDEEWETKDAKGSKRQWLTGSPFTVHVSGVRAAAAGSVLGGVEAYRKAALNQASPTSSPGAVAPTPDLKRSKSTASVHGSVSKEDLDSVETPPLGLRARGRRPSESVALLPQLAAGESLILRPQLYDEFGNASFASSLEDLKGFIDEPEATEHIAVPIKQRESLGSYELSYDLQIKGIYTMHVELEGEPIRLSPFNFRVLPGNLSVPKSILRQQTENPYVGMPCVLELEARDKFSNALESGGASVNARSLGTGVSPCTVEDTNDGKYKIVFSSSVVGEARVIVRLDNVEMAPVTISFVEDPSGKGKKEKGGGAKDEDNADGDSEPQESQEDLAAAKP